MKRLIGLWLLALSVRAYAFDTNVWPLSVNTNVDVYTNVLGNEFVSNVLYRSWSLGDTNWASTNWMRVVSGSSNDIFSRQFVSGVTTSTVTYTNKVLIFTNICVSNLYGPFVQDGFTGAVPVTAESFERLTDQLEAKLPSYSLPYYTTGVDYTFDPWFEKQHITGPVDAPVTNYPTDFPMATKADAFHKIGIGGLLYGDGAYDWPSNFYSYLSLATNQWGQVTNGTGYWTKRKNRVNPLIVAQWGPENASYPWPGWGGWFSDYPVNSYPALGATWYYSVPSEYNEAAPRGDDPALGNSRFIDLAPTQFPSFIWIPGGTNAFTALTNVVDNHRDGNNDSAGALWSSNAIRSADAFVGETQILSSSTTRADRAWVSSRTSMTGSPANSNDHVQLVWLDPVTTYEGTKAWDNVLLPEQLDEHFFLMTNMFLTPWTSWTWTNSMEVTNQYLPNVTNIYIRDVSEAKSNLWENYYTNGTMTNVFCGDVDPEKIIWWWMPTPNDPSWWFHAEIPEWSAPAKWDDTWRVLSNAVPPTFSWSLDLLAEISESYTATAAIHQVWTNFSDPTNFMYETLPTNWTFLGSREATTQTVVNAIGTSVKSQVAVKNLNETIPHRAHIYAKYSHPYSTVINSDRTYHRIAIVPTNGFTQDRTIVSDYVDLTTNILGFMIYPKVQEGGYSCTEYLKGGWFWEQLPDAVATASVWMYYPVWITNSASYVTNSTTEAVTNFLYRTNAIPYDATNYSHTLTVTNNADSNPLAWGLYTNADWSQYPHTWQFDATNDQSVYVEDVEYYRGSATQSVWAGSGSYASGSVYAVYNPTGLTNIVPNGATNYVPYTVTNVFWTNTFVATNLIGYSADWYGEYFTKPFWWRIFTAEHSNELGGVDGVSVDDYTLVPRTWTWGPTNYIAAGTDTVTTTWTGYFTNVIDGITNYCVSNTFHTVQKEWPDTSCASHSASLPWPQPLAWDGSITYPNDHSGDSCPYYFSPTMDETNIQDLVTRSRYVVRVVPERNGSLYRPTDGTVTWDYGLASVEPTDAWDNPDGTLFGIPPRRYATGYDRTWGTGENRYTDLRYWGPDSVVSWRIDMTVGEPVITLYNRVGNQLAHDSNFNPYYPYPYTNGTYAQVFAIAGSYSPSAQHYAVGDERDERVADAAIHLIERDDDWYNWATSGDSAKHTINTNISKTHTIDMKVLIEWDHP